MNNPSQKHLAICVFTCVISLVLVIDMKLRQNAIVAEQVRIDRDLREREIVSSFKPMIDRVLTDMGLPTQKIATIEDIAEVLNKTMEIIPISSELIPDDVGKDG